MATTTSMLVYKLTDLGVSGANVNSGPFVYNSATAQVDTMTVTDSGSGTLDDTFSDDAVGPNAGVTQQVIQNNFLGLSTAGKYVGLSAQFKVTGSDGSSFTAWVIRTQGNAASNPIGNSDDIFVMEEGLHNGVTYTFTYQTYNVQPQSYNNFVCFTPGARIATPSGHSLVENLKVGDLVITADDGLQAIRWIGKKYISGARLYSDPSIAPIKICANAFGQGVPSMDIWVSPQHRMLISNWQADLYSGTQDVLVAAKKLVNGHSIYTDHSIKQTYYIHMLFDRHQLIFANDAATESFFPAQYGIDAVGDEQRDELFEIFPELAFDPKIYGGTARPVVKGREVDFLRPA